MRKLIASAIIGLALTMSAQAQFTYLTNNGTITITKYTGPGGAVTIPSTTNGYPVTSIGAYAFYSSKSVTSVTIPNSVTNIGDVAFQGCSSLAEITIPNGVISIGFVALSFCDSLTILTIPDSVTNLGRGALDFDAALTNIIVASSNPAYSSMDGVLFDKNQATLLKYPQGKAGSYTIPDGVTSVAQYAFDYGSPLSSVTIPNSVTNIGDGEFAGCTDLTNIIVAPLNAAYISVDGVLFDKSQTRLIAYPSGKPGGYTISDRVTSIANYAFDYCVGLTSVAIPSSVTSIGSAAFWVCSNLTSVTIPNSVTYISRDAFNGCFGLTNVTIPNNLTTISQGTFMGCTSLATLTIPGGVTNIDTYAFDNCYHLAGLYFQGNAPGIAANIYGDTNLVIYYLPGTTGWGPTFGGRPTALWLLPNPLILGSSSSFGVQTNRFGFIISWATNLSVLVEASTSLGTPAWVPLSTNALVNGWRYFSDPEWANHPARFYRVRSL